MRTEERLQMSLVEYMKLQYPNVFVISEPSGIRVSMGLALKLKKLRSAHTHLDLYILEPVKGYHGLILELKDGKDKIFKKDGTFRSDKHLEDQIDTIEKLRKKGYYSTFAWDFDMAKEIIDDYLHGNN